MVDLAPGFESRNYCLKKSADFRTVIKSLQVVLPLLVVAASLSFYLWSRAQNIYTGYQLQELSLREADLLGFRQELIIEENILKGPDTLRAVAGNMGMILLQPDQIISASNESGDSDDLKMLSSILKDPASHESGL